MFNFLKDHPFAVEAFFKSSLVLTFAVPKDQLENFIPECLELDTFEVKWAFIAVAMVQTSGLRPKGFPEFTGSDFFLIGYRIFVRYLNNAGKSLRGLYIIRSETDSSRMEYFGNIFTHYNYSTTDIHQSFNNNEIKIISSGSNFKIVADINPEEQISLPDGSPFTDWKEARRYAGPLPFTFTFDKRTGKVLIIEGVRKEWNPKPVKVLNFEIGFINSLKLNGVILANAFVIENIPYYWKKGKVEYWKN